MRVALQEAFGREFELFEGGNEDVIRERFTGHAGCAAGTESADGAEERAEGLTSSNGNEPVVRPLGGSRWLVVVPIRGRDGRQMRAAGVVAGPDPEPLWRLARSAQQNARLKRRLRRGRKQLTAYADRVTRDFEELAWLRRLAAGIEYCEASSGPEQVAAALLPSLLEIIEAEAVAMIPARQPPTAGDRVSAGGEWCWAGKRRPRAGTACREIIARGGGSPAAGPVVRNGLRGRDGLSQSWVDSYIVVPIARGQWLFGWLVALNKRACDEPQFPGGHTAGLSEPEFGSFEAGLLAAAAVMLAAHARNADLFRQRELLLIGVIRTLVNAIDAKDAYTCGHSDRVARIAERLARELGLDEQDRVQVYMTGLLHDVGKIGVPDAILCKPGKLTEEEFAVVKRHPSMGFQILKHLAQLSYVLPGVLHHHEAVSGAGYPGGLAGESIPLPARILAVADAYDAMTSSRPYREAMPQEQAEAILRDGAGSQWDREVVAAFFRALDDIHEICVDSESRQQTLHEPTGDGLELPVNAFHERAASSRSPAAEPCGREAAVV
ncbi:MAG TPA: HD-GYP domain-containing protein [Planctomycetaceae bacterium]|nr:HD-GYP domain-containing protein [Planctomycetaceae bacterium]